MFDYLQQFNSLPKSLRDQVSSPEAMMAINELENKYQVDLAMAVMKLMIKSLAVKNLPTYFISEFGLARDKAESLTKELKEKLLVVVADYLGFITEMRALDLDKDINLVIKEAGLVLASEALINRFKSILSTYLKGVRNKIDAREALARGATEGGVNLSPAEIDRVFKVCATQKFDSLDIAPIPAAAPKPVAPATRLDEIMNTAQKVPAPAAEYNLKQALAKGQVNRPPLENKLDLAHELAPPAKELNLPQPVKTPVPIVPPVSPAVKVTVPLPPKPAATIPPKPASAPAPAPLPQPINRPSAPATNKPRMQDIKPMPKVMGPLEELQFLDPLNFRRLGKTPAEIVARVFAKIKLLEKDGYDRMILGVRAWRQSPVNRLYLRLGQEALAKGLTMKDIISVRQKNNQEFLTIEEIEAVVSLNSKLVF